MPHTARTAAPAPETLAPAPIAHLRREGEAAVPRGNARVPGGAERVLIERLRHLARESRLAERLDLHKACALIASQPGDAAERYGLALLSALGETAACRLVFHPAGSADYSFAERWLSGLVLSIQRGDGASVRFTLERVVRPAGRRSVRFLATGFADALGRLEAG